MQWSWKSFSDLTTSELYELLQLRQNVFVVEQKCAYLDCDGLDRRAFHLLGYEGTRLIAYLRALPPKIKVEAAVMGRVLIAADQRGIGKGRELMRVGLEKFQETFGAVPIQISAQSYLEEFYKDFGFQVISSPYLEDGIPHRTMLRE